MANPAMVRYQRFRLDPAHFRPAKYGEYFQDVLKRTDEFFQEEIVPLEGKAENILIVARPLSEFWKTPFGRNCSSAAFEYKNGEINMIYENKLYYDVDCPDWQQQIPVYKKGRTR